jgi:hypothetical protein
MGCYYGAAETSHQKEYDLVAEINLHEGWKGVEVCGTVGKAESNAFYRACRFSRGLIPVWRLQAAVRPSRKREDWGLAPPHRVCLSHQLP